MHFDTLDAPNPVSFAHLAMAGGALAAAGPPALVEVARRGTVVVLYEDRETGLLARADLSAILAHLEEAERRDIADRLEEAVEAALEAQDRAGGAQRRLDRALVEAVRAPVVSDHLAAIATALAGAGLPIRLEA
jgi:hypothetical protein